MPQTMSFPDITILSDLRARMLEASVGKGEQILIAQKWKGLAAKSALPRSLDEVGFRTFSQFDEDGILLYLFSVIGTTNRQAIEMAAGVGYESNTANLIINHNFSALLFEGNQEIAAQCKQFYTCHRDTLWNVPVEVDTTWLNAENVNQVIGAHGFSGEIDLLSLDLDGMDYWLLESLSIVQPRVIVLEYNGIFAADVTLAAAYEPDYVYQKGRANGASLAAFNKLCKKKGYRLIGCNRNCLNAFYVKEYLAKNVFPEVKVEDCLLSSRYPWWKKGGIFYETWMQQNGQLPNWQVVQIDDLEESGVASSDSPPVIPVLSDVYSHLRSEETEVLIAKIRNQIRKRNLGDKNSLPEDALTDCQFGELLDFGLNGKGQRHLGAGWHVAESAFTWTDALHASLHFNPPPSKGNLILEFTANGYTNSKIRYQHVIIEINGNPCCHIPISEKYTFSIVVPRSASASSPHLVIRFSCPNRASPSQFERGADPRVLGIALHSLIIRENPIQHPPDEFKPEQPAFSTVNGFDRMKPSLC
jgi:hypothetical protein